MAQLQFLKSCWRFLISCKKALVPRGNAGRHTVLDFYKGEHEKGKENSMQFLEPFGRYRRERNRGTTVVQL